MAVEHGNFPQIKSLRKMAVGSVISGNHATPLRQGCELIGRPFAQITKHRCRTSGALRQPRPLLDRQHHFELIGDDLEHCQRRLGIVPNVWIVTAVPRQCPLTNSHNNGW